MEKNYDEYIKFIESDKYKEYLNDLKIFYNKNTDQKCPKCNKNTLKKISNNEFKEIKCQNPKCNYHIKITVPNKINYFQLFNKFKNEKDNKLYQLTLSDETNFNKIKNEYLKLNKDFKEINNIINKQSIKINEIDEKILNNNLESYKLYNSIKNIKNIDINLKNSNDLLILFKNEKKLTQDRLKQIAKKLNIPFENVNKYYEWYNLSLKYIQFKKNNIDLNKEKYQILNDNINLNENLLDKVPEIIQIKKGGSDNKYVGDSNIENNGKYVGENNGNGYKEIVINTTTNDNNNHQENNIKIIKINKENNNRNENNNGNENNEENENYIEDDPYEIGSLLCTDYGKLSKNKLNEKTYEICEIELDQHDEDPIFDDEENKKDKLDCINKVKKGYQECLDIQTSTIKTYDSDDDEYYNEEEYTDEDDQ